jgi:hypothetical protein
MKRLLFTSSGLAALVIGAGLAMAQQSGQTMQPGMTNQTGAAPCAKGQANCEQGAGVVKGQRTTGEATQAPGGTAAPSANAQGYGRQKMPASSGQAAQTQCAPGQANCQAQPGATRGQMKTGQSAPMAPSGKQTTAQTNQQRNQFRATCPGSATNCTQPGAPAQPGAQGKAEQGMQQQAPATGTAQSTATGAPNAQANVSGTTGGTQQAKAEGRFNLQPQQAAQFHERLMRFGANETTNVNFNVSVGVALPATVNVRPLPPEIVAEYPEFRGFDFVVVHNEIVIVEPSTRKVVEVISSGGPQYGATTTNTVVTGSTLSSNQIRMVQEALDREGFGAGQPDGVWGPETQTAVLNFQRAKGIQPTGQLDPQTVSALGLNPQQFVGG